MVIPTPSLLPVRPRRSVAGIVVLFLALLGLCRPARAAEATAILDRNSVPAGTAALLTIEISGGNTTRPQMPDVPGLIVQTRGQQHSFQMINGVTTSKVSFTYAVGSQTPGEYSIPPISVTVDGAEVRTRELKLQVLAAGVKPPSAGTAAKPPNQGNTAPGNDSANAQFGNLVIEFQDTGRDHAWVGEIVPVRIKAAFPENVQVTSIRGLQPQGTAFTLHNLTEKPEQAEEVIDGKRHLVLSWYAGVSAAKAGKYVPELNLKATVAYRVRDSSRANRGGGFNDPIFDSFFARMEQKDLDLTSVDTDNTALEIRSLPDEGKPEDFSGAVGKFRIDAVGVPAKWMAGEPAEVTATVAGEGNFALLTQPAPSPAEVWKTYPGTSDFTPQDTASFSGSQLFRFNTVPQRNGKQSLSFSVPFFNPATGKYETAEYRSKEFEIGGADVAPPVAAAVDAGQPPPPPPVDPNRIAPPHPADTAVVSLTPPAWRTGFLPVCAAAGGMALLGLGLAAWRRVRQDPARRARAALAEASRAALAESAAMAARGDAPGFFAAGRRALQTHLAESWEVSAAGISLSDVAARLGPDSPVAQFFQEADRREFSGAQPPSPEALTEWNARLAQALESVRAAADKSAALSRSGLAGAAGSAVLAVFVAFAGQARAADFASAGADYQAGNFAQSAEAWQAVIRDSGASAARLYNLGNAQFRAGRTAAAILAWERAALLTPRDPDIRSNLAVARRQVALTADAPHVTWRERVLGICSLRGWSFLFAGSCLLTGALVLLQGIAGRRRLAMAGVVAGALAAVYSGTALRLRSPEINRAVLIGAEPTLRVSPIENAASAGTPGAGRVVQLEKRHQDWAWVRLPGTTTAGWIPSSQLDRIIPE